MKATTCDFCGKTTPGVSKDHMLYDVDIFPAQNYNAETDEEKALLFSAEDVCADCTRRVHQALTELRQELGKGKAS